MKDNYINVEAYDALGNPIILGNLYGASRNQNGVTTITIGRAKNITSTGRITIEVVAHKHALYEEKVKDVPLQRKSVNYLSSAVFPINEHHIL